jgi:flagellar biogenesis protein FliO
MPTDPVSLVSLAVGIGGIVFLIVGWRRARQTPQGNERITLVTSRYLGGKRMLTLVDVEGERLLLALSGDAVHLVARLPHRQQHAAEGQGAGDVRCESDGDRVAPVAEEMS